MGLAKRMLIVFQSRLIIQSKTPKRNRITISCFNIIFHDKSFASAICFCPFPFPPTSKVLSPIKKSASFCMTGLKGTLRATTTNNCFSFRPVDVFILAYCGMSTSIVWKKLHYKSAGIATFLHFYSAICFFKPALHSMESIFRDKYAFHTKQESYISQYFFKKSTKSFAVCQRISIFAAVITKKEMRTILVNTYWWWHSVQLTRS